MTAGLTTFLVRRLLTAILFVVVVSSSALVLTRLAPGDAATEIAPGGAAAIHDMRVRLHLDRPIALQLVAWLNSGTGTDTPNLDAETLLQVADDPVRKQQVQQAFAKAAETLQLPSSDAVIELVEVTTGPR